MWFSITSNSLFDITAQKRLNFWPPSLKYSFDHIMIDCWPKSETCAWRFSSGSETMLHQSHLENMWLRPCSRWDLADDRRTCVTTHWTHQPDDDEINCSFQGVGSFRSGSKQVVTQTQRILAEMRSQPLLPVINSCLRGDDKTSHVFNHSLCSVSWCLNNRFIFYRRNTGSLFLL